MAKIDTTATEVQASSEQTIASSAFSSQEFLKFRDKLFTSRQLIVPGNGHRCRDADQTHQGHHVAD